MSRRNGRRAVLTVPFSAALLPGFALQLRADLGWTAGGTVTWADQSPSAQNCIQATAARQPTQTAGAGPLGGSQPGIVFVGANTQHLDNVTSGILSGANNWTVYLVFKVTSTAANQFALCLGNSGGSGWGFGVGQSGANRCITAFGNITATFGAATTSFEKWTVQNNAGTVSARVNGSSVAVVGATTGTAPAASYEVGAFAGINDPTDGTIWEIAVYNAVHSAFQISQFEAYQHTFTGL